MLHLFPCLSLTFHQPVLKTVLAATLSAQPLILPVTLTYCVTCPNYSNESSFVKTLNLMSSEGLCTRPGLPNRLEFISHPVKWEKIAAWSYLITESEQGRPCSMGGTFL